jgi:hypothetical protein
MRPILARSSRFAGGPSGVFIAQRGDGFPPGRVSAHAGAVQRAAAPTATRCANSLHRGVKGSIILGGTMKIIGRVALAVIGTAGLAFATTAPAAAVGEHSHCLLTPTGYVPIAQGVSLEAPHDPALHSFHDYVHLGEPGREFLGMVISVPKGADCPPPPQGAVTSAE